MAYLGSSRPSPNFPKGWICALHSLGHKYPFKDDKDKTHFPSFIYIFKSTAFFFYLSAPLSLFVEEFRFPLSEFSLLSTSRLCPFFTSSIATFASSPLSPAYHHHHHAFIILLAIVFSFSFSPLYLLHLAISHPPLNCLSINSLPL